MKVLSEPLTGAPHRRIMKPNKRKKPDGIKIKVVYKICGRICHAFSIQLLPKKAKTGSYRFLLFCISYIFAVFAFELCKLRILTHSALQFLYKSNWNPERVKIRHLLSAPTAKKWYD